MPSYVYTYVLFHLLLNTSVSSRLTTILITRLITIRYTYHSQYDIGIVDDVTKTEAAILGTFFFFRLRECQPTSAARWTGGKPA
jgi:hypothetical protein